MRPETVRVTRVAAAAAGLLLASACVSESRRQLDATVAPEIATDTPESQRQVHIDLIRRMLDQNQYYAALAHVQAQVQDTGGSEELRLLEAEARRKLGQRDAAMAIYRDLLKTRYVAEAYHGLGLSNVQAQLPTAIWQLQQAVQRRPASAEMRNDLGYALMMAGRYNEAMPELATAVELEAGASGSDRARNNLVLLMLVSGDEAGAQRVVQQSGMKDDTLAGLRRQAQSLRARKTTPSTAPAVQQSQKPVPRKS